MARENPITSRSNLILSHGPISNRMGHIDPAPDVIQLTIDGGTFTFNPNHGDRSIKARVTYKAPPGSEILTRHKRIL